MKKTDDESEFIKELRRIRMKIYEETKALTPEEQIARSRNIALHEINKQGLKVRIPAKTKG